MASSTDCIKMEMASSIEAGDKMIDCNEKEPEAPMPLISNGVSYSEVPQHYIRLPTERPMLDEVVLSLDCNIHLVDL